MKETILQKYKEDIPVNGLRRGGAFLLDFLIFVIVSFLFILIGTSILNSTSFYSERIEILNSSMLECYKIEEEAKIYEFIGEGDEKYKHPRSQEEIFEEYCLRHILYSYNMDPEPFNKYNVEIKNPNNLEPASYQNDNLAYFYVEYVPLHNENNNIVDYQGDDPKLFFYKQFKNNSVDLSMWVFDEENYELPYLDGYFAIDLYKYLFENDDHQAGLTNYNLLAVSYQKLWEQEVEQLINSKNFNAHYQIYKENYATLSYIVDAVCFISYLLTFSLVWLLPQFIFKDGQTFGKRILNIRVIDKEGYPLMVRQKIIRNVISFFLLYGIMMVPCFLAGGLNSGWMYPLFEINGIGFSPFTFMAIFMIIDIVSFVIILGSRKKVGFDDMIADTICIDYRYHVDVIESKKIIIDENKKNKQKETIDTNKKIMYEEKGYFDSSCFDNKDKEEK